MLSGSVLHPLEEKQICKHKHLARAVSQSYLCENAKKSVNLYFECLQIMLSMCCAEVFVILSPEAFG